MSDKETNQAKKASRMPIQERSAVRMAKVLEATERMLEDIGPEKTSIPAVAAAAGVPRAAIYPFFPDKYAVYSHLAHLHMARLTETIEKAALVEAQSWRAWVNAVVTAAVEYYNAYPVASILLLQCAFADSDHDAHTAKNVTIGSLLRSKAKDLDALQTMPTAPDVAMIAIELAFACMKYGYAQEGKISPAIRNEAIRAITAYLEQWNNPT